jgi:hypothetical protein
VWRLLKQQQQQHLTTMMMLRELTVREFPQFRLAGRGEKEDGQWKTAGDCQMKKHQQTKHQTLEGAISHTIQIEYRKPVTKFKTQLQNPDTNTEHSTETA